MSREFGSCCSGYLHQQILQAAEDCLEGRDELTRLFGKVFKHLYDITYAISSSEASDSGPEYPIMETIKTLPKLKEDIHMIENYLEPFKKIMRMSVEAECQKRKNQKQ